MSAINLPSHPKSRWRHWLLRNVLIGWGANEHPQIVLVHCKRTKRPEKTFWNLTLSDIGPQTSILSVTCLNSPHISLQINIFRRPKKHRLMCGGLKVVRYSEDWFRKSLDGTSFLFLRETRTRDHAVKCR